MHDSIVLQNLLSYKVLNSLKVSHFKQYDYIREIITTISIFHTETNNWSKNLIRCKLLKNKIKKIRKRRENKIIIPTIFPCGNWKQSKPGTRAEWKSNFCNFSTVKNDVSFNSNHY